MNNALTLPGYKYYRDAATGDRPNIYVAFVNIERHDEETQTGVAGILFEVDASALAVLDARERNYRREDVTPHLSVAIEGTVWSYVGRPEARARYHHGRRTSSLVIAKTYMESVESAFARAGLPYTHDLPDDIPVVALDRIET